MTRLVELAKVQSKHTKHRIRNWLDYHIFYRHGDHDSGGAESFALTFRFAGSGWLPWLVGLLAGVGREQAPGHPLLLLRQFCGAPNQGAAQHTHDARGCEPGNGEGGQDEGGTERGDGPGYVGTEVVLQLDDPQSPAQWPGG
jgi:hypothetical protein